MCQKVLLKHLADQSVTEISNWCTWQCVMKQLICYSNTKVWWGKFSCVLPAKHICFFVSVQESGWLKHLSYPNYEGWRDEGWLVLKVGMNFKALEEYNWVKHCIKIYLNALNKLMWSGWKAVFFPLTFSLNKRNNTNQFYFYSLE